ncbi:MAG TPA: HAMP domain-containing sensor histidine kinase [Acidimicrobiales bacterium]|nr:HAMP domain-containing sensor histidine kinase [Acidimicrobiales bacterium]
MSSEREADESAPVDELTKTALDQQLEAERRWMATALDSALENLEAALADARAAEARSRRFLADAAHQLRTPLTGIRVAAENLVMGAEPADQDRLLGDVIRETARAGRLVASLLRVARLDEGEGLELVPCDVASVAADEVDRAWGLSPHLDFAFRVEGRPTTEPYLDPHALAEILGNLLDNARRFAVSRIDVLLRWVDDGVHVSVGDDGEGVAAGMEERIFDRFVSSGDPGTSGLGLSIARALAQAMGGDVAYEPPHFVLRLPTEPGGKPPNGA